MARHAGQHRPVVFVDHLDQRRVLPQVHADARPAPGRDHRGLRGGVHARRFDAPGLADPVAHVRREHLPGVGDHRGGDPQPPGELLLRQQRVHAGVPDERLRLEGVARGDDLGQRCLGRGARRRPRPPGEQARHEVPRDVQRRGRAQAEEAQVRAHPEQGEGAHQEPDPAGELGAGADEERGLAGAPRGAEDVVVEQRLGGVRSGQVGLHRGEPQAGVGDDLVEPFDQRLLVEGGQLGERRADRVRARSSRGSTATRPRRGGAGRPGGRAGGRPAARRTTACG